MISPEAVWPQVAVALKDAADDATPEMMEVYGRMGDYSTAKVVSMFNLINAGYILFATPREWDESWLDARRLSKIALRLKATRSPEIIRTR